MKLSLGKREGWGDSSLVLVLFLAILVGDKLISLSGVSFPMAVISEKSPCLYLDQ